MPKIPERPDRKIARQIDEFMKDRQSLRMTVDAVFHFFGIDLECQERMKDYLVDVWEAAGDDLCSILGQIESVLMFGLLGGCRAEYRPPFRPGEESIEPVQIILYNLCDRTEEYVKWVMAHETSHFILHHWAIPLSAQKKVETLNEDAADALAASWGFPRLRPKKKEEEKNGG